MREGRNCRIAWAPRVPQDKIRRLYASDAAGMLDDELVDEVAWMLYERCRDILIVTAASIGEATCPRCDGVVPHEFGDVRCACGWSCEWREYHESYKRRQLHGGGATPFFRIYVDAYPTANAPRERMLLIDRLINAFHRMISGADWRTHASAALRTGRVVLPPDDAPVVGRVAGVNLIEGRLRDVRALLDELAS